MRIVNQQIPATDRHEWFLNQIFRFRTELRRYLWRFTSGAEDLEDLIQETYVRVYSLSDFQVVSSPKAYLFTIARNLAIERARQNAIRATDLIADVDDLDLESSSGPANAHHDARCRFESFCAAVDNLPPICRRAFVLRKVYSLSHSEIAEVLGVSQSTVEKHVAKGLKRCRDYLRERGLLEDPVERERSKAPSRARNPRECP
jgi:RNA polymerase sigma-70 factor (ECF subfamily)